MVKKILVSFFYLLSLVSANKIISEESVFLTPAPVSFSAQLSNSEIKPYNEKSVDLSEKGVYCILIKLASDKYLPKSPSLFIGPSNYSIIVKLNGYEVYKWGELDNSVSMTNFGASVISLSDIKEGENELRIYFYSDGKNLPLPNFYIDEYTTVAKAAFWQTLFNLYLIQAIGIVALFSSILFFAYSAASQFKERDILYFSFFAFSIFMGYSHFIMNSPITNDLLWFKVSRIGYIFAAFLLLLFSSIYTFSTIKIWLKRLLFALLVMIVLIFMQSKTQGILNNNFSVFSMLYIIPIVSWCYFLLIRYSYKNVSIKLISIGYTFFVLGTIHDILSVLKGKDPYFWVTPYGYFMLITSIIFALVIRYYDGIKKREKVEEQLRQSQKMEAVGTLAGGIAHDFNNILTGIIGYIDLIEIETTDKNIKDYLNEILNASFRAKDLIQQILTFSRKTIKEKKTVELKTIIDECAKLLYHSIPSNIKLNIDIKSNPKINADTTQIHQVILNLCTNSYQAMQEKGGDLFLVLSTIEVKKGDSVMGMKLDVGRYAKIEVIDTGKGMSEEIIQRIYDPFFSTKNENGGTGLGLSVVHGIVKNHGGEISVYSQINKGTSFHIYFPILENDESYREINEVKDIDIRGEETILFADDEPSIRKLAEKMIPKYGYNIVICKNGIEALSEFKDNPNKYDIVITDMTMPGMTGLELAQQVMYIKKGTPVIICSGYSKFINEKVATEEKVADFISKPVTITEMLRNVRSVLNDNTNS